MHPITSVSITNSPGINTQWPFLQLCAAALFRLKMMFNLPTTFPTYISANSLHCNPLQPDTMCVVRSKIPWTCEHCIRMIQNSVSIFDIRHLQTENINTHNCFMWFIRHQHYDCRHGWHSQTWYFGRFPFGISNDAIVHTILESE